MQSMLIASQQTILRRAASSSSSSPGYLGQSPTTTTTTTRPDAKLSLDAHRGQHPRSSSRSAPGHIDLTEDQPARPPTEEAVQGQTVEDEDGTPLVEVQTGDREDSASHPLDEATQEMPPPPPLPPSLTLAVHGDGLDGALRRRPSSSHLGTEITMSTGAAAMAADDTSGLTAAIPSAAAAPPTKTIQKKPNKAKKKKSSYNSIKYLFAPTYKMRHHEFKKLFSPSLVPVTERLIVEYSCALQREILIQGRLYLSPHFLAFYANIFTWETSLVVPLAEVAELPKANTARVIPNAIHVVLGSGERHIFASFTSRDKAHLMIFRAWQNVLLEQNLTPGQIWSWVHAAYGDDLGLTSDDEADYVDPAEELELQRMGGGSSRQSFSTGTTPTTTTTTTTSEEGEESEASDRSESCSSSMENVSLTTSGQYRLAPLAGGPVVVRRPAPRKPSRKDRTPPPPAAAAASLRSQLEATTTTAAETSKDPLIKSSLPPLLCDTPQFRPHCYSPPKGSKSTSDGGGKFGAIVMDTILPLDVDKAFQLAFTDNDFLRRFLDSRGTYGISMQPWREIEATHSATTDSAAAVRGTRPRERVRVRQIVFSLPVNHPLAKSSTSTEYQRLAADSLTSSHYVIQSECTNENVPYADIFQVHTLWCLSKESSAAAAAATTTSADTGEGDEDRTLTRNHSANCLTDQKNSPEQLLLVSTSSPPDRDRKSTGSASSSSAAAAAAALSQCRLHVHCNIVFTKSPWGASLLKPVIEKRSVEGVTAYANDLVSALHTYAANPYEVTFPANHHHHQISDEDSLPSSSLSSTSSGDNSKMDPLQRSHHSHRSGTSRHTHNAATAAAAILTNGRVRPVSEPRDQATSSPGPHRLAMNNTALLVVILALLLGLLLMNGYLYVRLWELESTQRVTDLEEFKVTVSEALRLIEMYEKTLERSQSSETSIRSGTSSLSSSSSSIEHDRADL